MRRRGLVNCDSVLCWKIVILTNATTSCFEKHRVSLQWRLRGWQGVLYFAHSELLDSPLY